MNNNLTKDGMLASDANYVYVLCAWYSDRSGFALLGVYRSLQEVDDRKKILHAAGSLMCVEYIKMPLDRANKMEIC